MTTNRKSENHNPNGPHDLGQITDNPLPWVIVEKAGTDDESIYSEHATYRAAIQHAIKFLGYEFYEAKFLGYEFYEDGFVIMRRLDDGVLTTEF